jgi:hypothetical protein
MNRSEMHSSSGSFFDNLSVKTKLILLAASLLSALVFVVAFTAYTLGKQKEDGTIINLAGRQRMLTQKYSKEVMDELGVRQVAASARRIAAGAATQIASDRAIYTKRVVGKLKREWPDFKASANYANISRAIPLPATFVREVSETMGDKTGYRYTLISKYNINKKKGLNTEFERNAWTALKQKPNAPYYELVANGAGVDLRYATADVAAAPACVSCHNQHAESPKKDFRLNELMGILVVTTSATKDAGLAKRLLSDAKKTESKTGKLFEVTLAALQKGGES